MRDERLQVEVTILLLKTTTLERLVGHYMRDERLQVEDNILLFKRITMARQAGHCMGDERLQVEGNTQKNLQVSTIYALAKARQRAQPSLWQCSAKTSTR